MRATVPPGMSISAVGLRELLRPADVLRHVAFGMQLHRHLDLGVGLFADRVQVIADHRLLAGLQQHAGIAGVDLGVLARGVLDEEVAAFDALRCRRRSRPCRRIVDGVR